MHLADLLPTFIQLAHQILASLIAEKLAKSIATLNAVDLSKYANASVENIMLFGMVTSASGASSCQGFIKSARGWCFSQ